MPHPGRILASPWVNWTRPPEMRRRARHMARKVLLDRTTPDPRPRRDALRTGTSAPMTATHIVIYAYLEALLCLFIIMVYPRGRLAHGSALAAIAFAMLGGAAWSYQAFFEKSEWPQFSITLKSNSTGSIKAHFGAAKFGREAEMADAAGYAGASGSAGFLSRHQTNDEETVTDCEHCPLLIPVPAGTAKIGADDHDKDATPAERPAVEARFWPGFLISAAPVSAASFHQFQIETNRKPASCGPKSADLAPSPEVPGALGHAPELATCVSADDAEAYANWLTAATGKRFHLPTAAEWEYAARVLPAPGMETSRVAEIVADCWHTQIPLPGMERIATQTGTLVCNGRILKGAAASEEARWHRFSARRQFGATDATLTTGFRVMRALDGMH